MCNLWVHCVRWGPIVIKLHKSIFECDIPVCCDIVVFCVIPITSTSCALSSVIWVFGSVWAWAWSVCRPKQVAVLNAQSQLSKAVVTRLFYSRTHFDFGNPHILAHVNIQYPNDRYPKLKIYISEPILDSCQYKQVAYVTVYCMIWLTKQAVTRFVDAVSFLTKYSNGRTK